MEEQETTEMAPESPLGDALEGASPPGTPLCPHPALRYPSRERRPPRRLICEMPSTVAMIFLLNRVRVKGLGAHLYLGFPSVPAPPPPPSPLGLIIYFEK